jgi:hypothetical protein
VLINDTPVANIPAPAALSSVFSHQSLLINDTNLMALSGATLEFRLCPGSLADLLLAGILSPFFTLEESSIFGSMFSQIQTESGSLDFVVPFQALTTGLSLAGSIGTPAIPGSQWSATAAFRGRQIPFLSGIEFIGNAAANSAAASPVMEMFSTAFSEVAIFSRYQVQAQDTLPVGLDPELRVHATIGAAGNHSPAGANAKRASLLVAVETTTDRARRKLEGEVILTESGVIKLKGAFDLGSNHTNPPPPVVVTNADTPTFKHYAINLTYVLTNGLYIAPGSLPGW